jgi:quinoprotein glucose dehydrogenase
MSKRLAAAVCGALLLPLAAFAQTPSAASKGIYSLGQLARGADLYASACARCHGASMEGLDVAPPLTGQRFLGNWTNQSVADLAKRIRTSMPLDMPGSLGLQASADLTASLLAANGYPAGAADLPANASAQQPLMIDSPPAK